MVEKTSDIVISQINKRIDNMENRVTKRLETVEENITNVVNNVKCIEVLVNKNTIVLEEHMKRTALNEEALKEFRQAHLASMIEFKTFQSRVLGGLAVAAFLIPFLLNLLNKVM